MELRDDTVVMLRLRIAVNKLCTSEIQVKSEAETSVNLGFPVYESDSIHGQMEVCK